MRIILYVLASIIVVFVVTCLAFRADAASPKLAYKDGSEEFALPEQAPMQGSQDFLLELRGEYPGYSMVILTHFPQGLGKELDKALVERARELHTEFHIEALKAEDDILADVMAEVSSALLEKEPVPGAAAKPGWESSYLTSSTYTGSRASDKVFSINYMVYWFTGGAHPNRVYRTWTYDVASGRELALSDIFPGRDSVEPALARLAIEALAGKVDELTEDMMNINMERIVLTPEGMQIVYSPYEIASYAEGEFFVEIPLKKLVPLGANMALWK